MERSIHELNNRLIERTAAFMEQAAKDAQRIRDLEAQQQNWRLSSACREKQLRIEMLELALREIADFQNLNHGVDFYVQAAKIAENALKETSA